MTALMAFFVTGSGAKLVAGLAAFIGAALTVVGMQRSARNRGVADQQLTDYKAKERARADAAVVTQDTDRLSDHDVADQLRLDFTRK